MKFCGGNLKYVLEIEKERLNESRMNGYDKGMLAAEVGKLLFDLSNLLGGNFNGEDIERKVKERFC